MKKNKKYLLLIIFLLLYVFFNSSIFANENNTYNTVNDVSSSFGLDSYIEEINGCIKDLNIDNIDINELSKELISGKGIGFNNIITNLISLLLREVFSSLKGALIIFFIIIIMAIMSAISLDKKSEITNIVYLVCFIAIATISITTFKDTIELFTNTTDKLSKIMQIVSPFVIAILIGTGAVTSTGIIQPMLLFISSFIGFIITYIVVPLLSISVALNIVSAMSDNLEFSKLSKTFNKAVIWIVGIVLTLFLGMLSLETSLSSSIDSLTVNVTQAAVSNFIPVVGKFFSDSLETVIGSAQIIGKTGGIIGVVTIIIISCIPVLKILSILIIYVILSAICEPICNEKKITKFLDGFVDVYKTILGILIGVDILFIISTGIIINLCSKIT